MKQSEAKRLREKRLADHLFRRIFSFLQEPELWKFRLVKLRGNIKPLRRLGHGINTVGCVEHDNEVIWIDYRDDVLPTLVHECLHALYPDASERRIIRLENLCMRQSGPLRGKRLLAQLAFLLW